MPTCFHVLETHVLPKIIPINLINDWIKFKEYEGFSVYLFTIKTIRLAFVGIETIVWGGMYFKENKPFPDPFAKADNVPSGQKAMN
jgi:hypothetical protein